MARIQGFEQGLKKLLKEQEDKKHSSEEENDDEGPPPPKSSRTVKNTAKIQEPKPVEEFRRLLETALKAYTCELKYSTYQNAADMDMHAVTLTVSTYDDEYTFEGRSRNYNRAIESLLEDIVINAVEGKAFEDRIRKAVDGD